MLIVHATIEPGYGKVPNDVATDPSISPQARCLYMVYRCLKPDSNYPDTYFVRVMGISRSSVQRLRKELTGFGLLYVECLGPRKHVLYVGTYQCSAKQCAINLRNKQGKISNGSE
jgi:hypothetical protein